MAADLELVLLNYGHIRHALWEIADRDWQTRLWNDELDGFRGSFNEMMNVLFSDSQCIEFLREDAYRVGLRDSQITLLRDLLTRLDEFAVRLGSDSHPTPKELHGMPEWTEICDKALETLRVLDDTIGNIANECLKPASPGA